MTNSLLILVGLLIIWGFNREAEVGVSMVKKQANKRRGFSPKVFVVLLVVLGVVGIALYGVPSLTGLPVIGGVQATIQSAQISFPLGSTFLDAAVKKTVTAVNSAGAGISRSSSYMLDVQEPGQAKVLLQDPTNADTLRCPSLSSLVATSAGALLKSTQTKGYVALGSHGCFFTSTNSYWEELGDSWWRGFGSWISLGRSSSSTSNVIGVQVEASEKCSSSRPCAASGLELYMVAKCPSAVSNIMYRNYYSVWYLGACDLLNDGRRTCTKTLPTTYSRTRGTNQEVTVCPDGKWTVSKVILGRQVQTNGPYPLVYNDGKPEIQVHGVKFIQAT